MEKVREIGKRIFPNAICGKAGKAPTIGLCRVESAAGECGDCTAITMGPVVLLHRNRSCDFARRAEVYGSGVAGRRCQIWLRRLMRKTVFVRTLNRDEIILGKHRKYFKRGHYKSYEQAYCGRIYRNG